MSSRLSLMVDALARLVAERGLQGRQTYAFGEGRH
jgi:hypothetical protein